MQRDNFLKLISFGIIAPFGLGSASGQEAKKNQAKKVNPDTREYWIQVMQKLADPVLENLSIGKLKANMPIEAPTDRSAWTHLEAFGRVAVGIASWLSLGTDETKEGKLRGKYIELFKKSLRFAVDPSSPDFMNFTEGGQPVVDAAFLAHGFLKAPEQLWKPLDTTTKRMVIDAFKSSRAQKSIYNNHLLFSAIIEVFLLYAGEKDWDPIRIDYAIRSILQWYKGDGVYGDGPELRMDYYNSFVIHPMMLDIMKVLVDNKKEKKESYDLVLKRAKRYAVILERLISPEGTFPPIGRSLTYRFGAFQNLLHIALLHELPEEIKPAQVRSAMSAVIYRMIEAPGTFDEKGWLRLGFCGHQPSFAERYISTGSLYLCSVGLLTLGLPATDPFWTSPAEDWTSKKAWRGENVPIDRALSSS